MKYLGFLFAGLVLLLLAAGGYVFFFLFTPITPGNVASRMTQTCYVGMSVKAYSRPASRPPGSAWNSCQCVAAEIINREGVANAVQLADTARRLVIHRLTHRSAAERVKEGGVPDAYMQRLMQIWSRLDDTCRG